MTNDELKKKFKTIPTLMFKITTKEFAEDIVNNGHFYFRNVKYFREGALANPSSLIYDINECSITRKQEIYVKLDGEYEKLFGSDFGNMSHSANQCIFCTYAPRGKPQIGNNTIEYIVSKDVIKEICNGGDSDDFRLVSFEFPYKTLNKISDYYSDNNLKGAKGYVAYDDHDYIPPKKHEYLDAAFHKDKKFNKQNEFRLVLLNSENEDYKNFYIGKLDDDEFKLYEIEKNKNLKISVTFRKDVYYKITDKSCIGNVEDIKYEWINN